MKNSVKLCFLTAAMGVVFTSPAIEPGAVIFADGFESTGTFAENWQSHRCRSIDGIVRVPSAAGLKTRVATPLEFCVDVDLRFDPAWSKGPLTDGKGRGWAGIAVESKDFLNFAVKPDGTTFLVWRLRDQQRSMGKYLKIDGYQKGDTIHLQVVRKKAGEGVKYAFYVNGKPSGDFFAVASALVKGADGRDTYEPPRLFSYREDVEFDNFQLANVKHDDDSPNMITNSGFEFDEDGVPPFYNFMGDFNWASAAFDDFENKYLKRYHVDTEVKHSGKQSLRIRIDKTATGTAFRPWGAGTVKDKPGVFSVWMKSSVAELPVTIEYGPKWRGKKHDGNKTVKVGTEWARYEVTCDALPGKGIYSPVAISVSNLKVPEATLWVDDLQAESVTMPEGGFKEGETYATKYMPAETDKGRFDPPKDDFVKPAPIKLPLVEKPSIDKLDGFIEKAAVVDRFYNVGKDPSLRTTGFLGCDKDNLYVAYRCYGDKPERWNKEKADRKDAMNHVCGHESTETLFAPYGGEDYFHFFADPIGNKAELFAKDLAFDGTWSHVAKAKGDYTDYLFTFPLADFAASGLRDKWLFNLCRNMTGAGGMEWVCAAKTKRLAFNNLDTFRELVFPNGILDPYRKGPEVPEYGLHKGANKAEGRRILGRLDFYMNEPEAKFRVFEEDGSFTEHSLDITKMPCGTNAVKVAGFDTTVVKLPYWKGATQINRWIRAPWRNGKGVIETGLFLGNVHYMKDGRGLTNAVDFLASRGIHHAMQFAHARPAFIPSARTIIGRGQDVGVDFVLWSSPFFGTNRYNDVVSMDAWLKAFKFDNLLSVLAIDEPELWCPADETERQLIAMKARFPYTPVQMNNTNMGIPQRFANLRTDILMLDDYLANNEGRSVWSVVKQVPIMLEAGKADGKPPHFFIESGVNSLHFKSPTYAEQVAQSWGCIAAGCTGIWWYEGYPTTEGPWRAIVDINREVQSIVPALVSEEVPAQVRGDIDREKVISKTCKLGDEYTIVTCNLEPKTSTVTYSVPGEMPRTGKVEVLFENRALELKDGRFTDTYRPLERHVYKIMKYEL